MTLRLYVRLWKNPQVDFWRYVSSELLCCLNDRLKCSCIPFHALVFKKEDKDVLWNRTLRGNICISGLECEKTLENLSPACRKPEWGCASTFPKKKFKKKHTQIASINKNADKFLFMFFLWNHIMYFLYKMQYEYSELTTRLVQVRRD